MGSPSKGSVAIPDEGSTLAAEAEAIPGAKKARLEGAKGEGSTLAAEAEVAEDRGCGEDMVKGKGKGEGAKGSQPDAKMPRVRPIEDSGERCSEGLLDLRWIEAGIAETNGFTHGFTAVPEDALQAMLHWEIRRRIWVKLALAEDQLQF